MYSDDDDDEEGDGEALGMLSGERGMFSINSAQLAPELHGYLGED